MVFKNTLISFVEIFHVNWKGNYIVVLALSWEEFAFFFRCLNTLARSNLSMKYFILSYNSRGIENITVGKTYYQEQEGG